MSYNYYAPSQAAASDETPQGLAIKKSLGSGIFLVAVISYSITALISLYRVVFPGREVFSMILNLFYELGIAGTMIDVSEIQEMFQTIAPWLNTVNLFSFLPVALVTLALWLVYGGARKKATVKGTAGLTILQIIAVLSLVGLCFSLLLVIFLMIIGVTGGGFLDSSFELEGKATAIIAAVFIMIIAVIIFEIVYYAKLSSLYSNAKSLSRNERVRKKASLFVIVIAFFSVVGSVITLVTSVLTVMATLGMSLSSILTLVSSFFMVLYNLFLAITYIKLRSQEEPFTHVVPAGAYSAYAYQSSPSPAYGQNPYAPYPAAPAAPQAAYAPNPQNPYGVNPYAPNPYQASYPNTAAPANASVPAMPAAPASPQMSASPVAPAPQAADAASAAVTDTSTDISVAPQPQAAADPGTLEPKDE